jgi:Fic family protein
MPDVGIEEVYESVRIAQKELLALDLALSALPDVNAIGLLVRLEAVESSAAEGTTSTFSELVAHEAARTNSPDVLLRVQDFDVQSVKAVVDSFPETVVRDSSAISPIRRARMIHGLLFPRESTASWLGFPLGDYKRPPNATTDKDAAMGLFHYTHPDRVAGLMLKWQDQTVGRNERRPLEPIVRQALSHWLFEHIHPFADGNGRVGRLLTPIMLWRQGSTQFPCGFYGEPVRQSKSDYIDALKESRRSGNLALWVRYFCFLLSIGARENRRRIEALGGLTVQWRGQLEPFRSDSLVHALLPLIILNPVVSVKNVQKMFPNISFNTVNTTLGHFVKLGILRLMTQRSRDRFFANTAVLDLFDTQRRAHALRIHP